MNVRAIGIKPKKYYSKVTNGLSMRLRYRASEVEAVPAFLRVLNGVL